MSPKNIEDIEIASRRQKIYDFRIRGISPANMAKTLSISERTVFNDLRVVQDNVIDHLKNTPKINMIVTELMTAERMEDEVRSEYFTTPSSSPIAKNQFFRSWLDI